MLRFAAARVRQVLYYEVHVSEGTGISGRDRDFADSSHTHRPRDSPALNLINHLNARSLALVVEGVKGCDEEMLVKVGR